MGWRDHAPPIDLERPLSRQWTLWPICSVLTGPAIILPPEPPPALLLEIRDELRRTRETIESSPPGRDVYRRAS